MVKPGSFQTLSDWLAWLETLSPNEIDLGLERVEEVLQRLQLARPNRVIHVAGTNGKGSSAAMLEALFLQQSKSVGCYTSPHIHRYNERIRVAGNAVGDEVILQAFERVESERNAVPLTYFEFGTLAALCVFDQAQVETTILEIGLGGRLDAVNVVEPDAGIITNVSLDHVAWLGSDVDTIAAEKAGILRSGKPFVFANEQPPQAIVKKAKEMSSDLRVLNRDYAYNIASEGSWQFCGRDYRLPTLQAPSLAGEFQIHNAAGVLALVEAMGETALLDANLIDAAFSALQLAGRFQIIERRQQWILDVAHNAGAARALADSVVAIDRASIDNVPRLRCVIGILDDKNIADIVEPLLPFVSEWISVTAASPRAFPAAELGRVIANMSGQSCLLAGEVATVCEELDADESSELPVLVTGSFLTVGPALGWLAANPDRQVY